MSSSHDEKPRLEFPSCHVLLDRVRVWPSVAIGSSVRLSELPIIIKQAPPGRSRPFLHRACLASNLGLQCRWPANELIHCSHGNCAPILVISAPHDSTKSSILDPIHQEDLMTTHFDLPVPSGMRCDETSRTACLHAVHVPSSSEHLARSRRRDTPSRTGAVLKHPDGGREAQRA